MILIVIQELLLCSREKNQEYIIARTLCNSVTCLQNTDQLKQSHSPRQVHVIGIIRSV